ncbi:MAG: hypothetical protein AB7P76_04550 [Candidatus Melainabacteria bacterium]
MAGVENTTGNPAMGMMCLPALSGPAPDTSGASAMAALPVAWLQPAGLTAAGGDRFQGFMSGVNCVPGITGGTGRVEDVLGSLMATMGTVMQQLQQCLQALTNILGNKAVKADDFSSQIQTLTAPSPGADTTKTAQKETPEASNQTEQPPPPPAPETAAPSADVQALYDKWLPQMGAMPEADRKPFIDYVVARAKDIPGSPKPDWILQIVKIESGFNPKASNDFEEGHFGLFQIKGEPNLMDVTPMEQMGRWVDFLKSKAAMFGPMDNVDTLMKAQSGGYTIEAT